MTILCPLGCGKREPASEPPVKTTAPRTGGGLAFPLHPPALTEIETSRVFGRLDVERPVFITTAPGDAEHLYVVEQGGTIARLVRGSDGREHEEFLNLTDRVRREHNEEGLLGLAFAPDYATSGVFYVFYSASNPRRSQISRFRTGTDGRGDPKTEDVVLSVEQPFGNHNGGALVFGPDGHLYAGFGDGGSGGDPFDAGQDRTNLLGTIVRISVGASGSYEVPRDNPFVSEKGVRKEIWAFGLRNPWRMSFDRQRGDLWVADVGQDNLEEVDIVVRGGNYGWRIREGSQAFAASKTRTDKEQLIGPIAEYGRGLGESITGGYVYRGLAIPSLRGAYVYGDFVTGNLWALRRAADGTVQSELIGAVPELSSFGEDQEGELYALSFKRGIVQLKSASSPDTAFPRKLSETGLFTDVATLTPAASLRPYEPTVELWSDGAEKLRWVVLPEGGKVEYSRDDAWQFPVGTVTVKHFELPLDDREPTRRRRVETRVMVHEADGWSGYTYRWNEGQTDAELLTAPMSEAIAVIRNGAKQSQVWEYPAGNLCMRCHTESYGRVLGLRTHQLHRPDDDLIARWREEGLFANPPPAAEDDDLPSFPRLDDESAPLEARARAYLETNCALCHNPARDHASSVNLLFAAALEDAKLVDHPSDAPLGLAEERRVHAGQPNSSALWVRMTMMGPQRMPPLATQRVDPEGTQLVRRWIESLDASAGRQ